MSSLASLAFRTVFTPSHNHHDRSPQFGRIVMSDDLEGRHWDYDNHIENSATVITI